MNILILDASVLGALLFNESPVLYRRITSILKLVSSGKAKIVAPGLLPLEISNVIKNRVKKAEAIDLFNDFSNLPIEFLSLSLSEIKDILGLACDYNVTTYDASYHFLAKKLGGTFVTCDRKYFEKAKKLGSIELIT